ncbi:MAG: alpha-L-rhamnosidase [Planctomycetota bacterium]|jgi:alpha-L-rhamnosidase
MVRTLYTLVVVPRSRPMRLATLLGSLLLAFGLNPDAISSQNVERAWEAEWIGVPIQKKFSPRSQWLCYRGTLSLPSEPESALARIAVDSRYWLWVNGEPVIYEGGLKRGPTPNDTYYDVVELAPHLHAGDNSVALLMWHFGKQGFSHKNSGRAGLYFDVPNAAGSGPEWRCIPHPAYGLPEPFEPFPNYRLAESDVRYDARLALGDWTAEGFADADWATATPLGSPPCEPWGKLIERPIPQLRDLGLQDYVGGEIEPQPDGSTRIRCRLPSNATIHPWLRVRATAGLSIDIRTDNYQGGGERNLRHQYVTRDGVQEYECLSYLNGTEVLYTLPAGVELLELRFRETRYDSSVVGHFSCDDPLLQQLRQKALDTLPLNLRDGIQDPDRERAQWWGDVVNVIPQLFVTYDESSHQIMRKAIHNLFDWQREDGSLFSPVPSGSWNRELPLQMLASIGEYGLARYVLLSGDFETLRAVYPRMLRYIDLWKIGEDGLVIQRPGEWTWIDWGDYKDTSLLYDAWFHLALRGVQRMAGWMGDDERSQATLLLSETHAQAFRAQYWRDGEFRSPEHQGKTDDRGNALAVLAGLSRPEDASALEALLLKQRHASPYMERYALEALFELGDGSSALKRMRARYARMVKDSSPTLWERWDLDSSRSSSNHAWGGSPLHLLPEFVAGVMPILAGYERFRIRPKLGALDSVRAAIPTVAGEIRVHIERSSRRLDIALESPQGTRAVLELPAPIKGEWKRVMINDQLRWQSGESAGTSPPTFDLGPGQHQIRAIR